MLFMLKRFKYLSVLDDWTEKGTHLIMDIQFNAIICGRVWGSGSNPNLEARK